MWFVFIPFFRSLFFVDTACRYIFKSTVQSLEESLYNANSLVWLTAVFFSAADPLAITFLEGKKVPETKHVMGENRHL